MVEDTLDVRALRKDFPVLERVYDGKPLIYLDSACMTLKPRPVIDAIMKYYTDFPACGGRSVHKLGTQVSLHVDAARTAVRDFFGAEHDKEIIFTRNATESINLVSHAFGVSRGDRVLTTDHEHNSNLAPWHTLRAQKGIKHEVVPSREDDQFDLETFSEMMGRDVKLVSMVHTSNLNGYTIPAGEIIEIAHDYGAKVLLDAAQSAPHRPVDVGALDVDFLAASIHKMCGPTGVGVLYGKYDELLELEPFIVGGDTVSRTTYEDSEFLDPPERFEGGLQDYAGIMGAGTAAKYLQTVGLEKIQAHEIRLNHIITDLIKHLPGISIIGPAEPALRGGIVSFVTETVDHHDIALVLDEMSNIMIRSGMHCVHSWFLARNLRGSVRASLYLYNTEEEAKFFAEQLEQLLELLG